MPTTTCASSPAAAALGKADKAEDSRDTRLPGLSDQLSRRRAGTEPTGGTHRSLRELRPHLAPTPTSGGARQGARGSSRSPANRAGTRSSAASGTFAGAGAATTPASPAGGGLERAGYDIRVARACHPRRDHRPEGGGGDVAGGGTALRLGGAACRTARARARTRKDRTYAY